MNEKILIIEDETAMRENIAQILELEGFTPVVAANGREGLDKIFETEPDLILCDVSMGRVSGYDVIEQVQADRRTAHIPFLFITARAEKQDILHGIKLGADDYITKPFTHSNLIACIRKNIEKKLNGINRIKNLQDSIKNSFPHELRTPLTGIMGFADLLKKSADTLSPDDIREYANNILENADRLNYLTDMFLSTVNLDLLEAEKGINGRGSNESYSCPMKLVNELVLRLEEKNVLHFHLNIKDDTAVYFSADLLTRVFSELLENAVKFSDHGEEILISSKVTNKDLIILIENVARNMTAEDVDMIDEFVQLNRKHNEHRGLGLGLAFARKSIRFFGGDFRMGIRDTKFFIEIKLKRCEDRNECFVN